MRYDRLSEVKNVQDLRLEKQDFLHRIKNNCYYWRTKENER